MAKDHRGTFDGECPFYCSYSGSNDELLWAATWLYKATKQDMYHKYITEEAVPANVAEFSWDLKYSGAQVLLSELFWLGNKEFQGYKDNADGFICFTHPDSPYHQVFITPGGMVHMRDGANGQYVTGTSFLLSVYGDLLARNNVGVQCGDKQLTAIQVTDFAKKQEAI